MKTLLALVCLCFSVAVASAADTIYVHPNAEPGGNGSSWNAPFRTMAIAMAAAQPGDEIWAARGTFRLATPLQVKNGVRLYGGFEGTETLRERRDWFRKPTIIEPTTGVKTLLVMNQLDSSTRLDGVVLQGATESAVVVSGGAPVFFNCLFRDNTGQMGAAIRATGVSRLRIEFCTFTRNSATAEGGAVYLSSIATDSTYAYGPFIGESLFDKNYAANGLGGAIMIDSCASIPQIASCVFSSNVALFGGAIATTRTYLYVTNSTFSKNILAEQVDGRGRALFLNGGFLQNSIIWGGDETNTTKHVADVDVVDDTTTLKATACLVEQDFDFGFWQNDPQFEDINNVYGTDGFFGTDDDGLRLSSFSQVRDGGVIDGFVNHQNCDAIGNARLVGRKNDLGAYESQRSGRTGFREAMDELRTGKLVIFFRHAKTDWNSKDKGPEPGCFPGRNLIWEGREQSREIGKHWISLGVPIGDAFASPVCRCWETVFLMTGRYEKKSYWASGGTTNDPSRWADLETIPTNGNRVIVTHDAVANYLFNPAGDGSLLTTAEIMEGDAVIFRPTGDTIEVVAQWSSDTWERYFVRFPDFTSVDDDQLSTTASVGIVATPLPASDRLRITTQQSEPVRIIDIMGRTVAELPSGMSFSVDVSLWAPGMYSIIGTESGRSTTAVVRR